MKEIKIIMKRKENITISILICKYFYYKLFTYFFINSFLDKVRNDGNNNFDNNPNKAQTEKRQYEKNIVSPTNRSYNHNNGNANANFSPKSENNLNFNYRNIQEKNKAENSPIGEETKNKINQNKYL